MNPWRWFLFAALAASSAASTSDASERCVEEVAGVCIKYAPKRQLSDAERGEAALRLSPDDRKLVQRGLARSGAYRGAIDGALGAKSRQAIAIWQASRGEASTGHLTALQFADLREVALTEAVAEPAAGAIAAAAAPEQEPVPIEETVAEADETQTALAAPTAPEPPTEAEPVVEAAPSPLHPVAGRTYEVKTTRKRNGTPFEVRLRRTGENSAELRVRILGMHGGTLSKTCDIPIDSAFRCSKNRGGVRWTFTGQLPKVRVANDWGGDDVRLWP